MAAIEAEYEESLNELVEVSQRFATEGLSGPVVASAMRGGTISDLKFKLAFGYLANADGYAALKSAEVTLPALVSGDAAARAESSAAKKQLQAMWSRAYARADIYAVLQEAASVFLGYEKSDSPR